MTKVVAIFLCTLFIGFPFVLNGQSPVGIWKAFDGDTGQPRSLMKLYIDNGILYGKVIKLFRREDENPHPLCFNCKEDDPRHDQPVLGMVLLSDLVKKNKCKWVDGNVLDPDHGNIYSCYLEMLSPDRIKVRGYLGFSLFGRTHYLYREHVESEGLEVLSGQE